MLWISSTSFVSCLLLSHSGVLVEFDLVPGLSSLIKACLHCFSWVFKTKCGICSLKNFLWRTLDSCFFLRICCFNFCCFLITDVVCSHLFCLACKSLSISWFCRRLNNLIQSEKVFQNPWVVPNQKSLSHIFRRLEYHWNSIEFIKNFSHSCWNVSRKISCKHYSCSSTLIHLHRLSSRKKNLCHNVIVGVFLCCDVVSRNTNNREEPQAEDVSCKSKWVTEESRENSKSQNPFENFSDAVENHNLFGSSWLNWGSSCLRVELRLMLKMLLGLIWLLCSKFARASSSCSEVSTVFTNCHQINNCNLWQSKTVWRCSQMDRVQTLKNGSAERFNSKCSCQSRRLDLCVTNLSWRASHQLEMLESFSQ